MGHIIPVPPIVEMVDHVVPGVVVLAVALFGVFAGRIPLIAALAATLAGFWITATHVPAIRDGFRGLIDGQATVIHSVPGILILFTAGLAAIKAYKEMPE